MHKSIEEIIKKYRKFTTLDWVIFCIGVGLILNITILTLLEWHFVSIENVQVFKALKQVLDANKNIFTPEQQNLIYPNAIKDFWGGSTYWFTFMTNVYLAITLAFFSFYKQSKKAQVMFFASIVYISITCSMYWLSVIIDPEQFNKLSLFSKIKSVIYHAVTPFIAIVLIIFIRKELEIDNIHIWALIIFPLFYYLFTLAIYFIGYKYYANFKVTDSEIDRGIVIYSQVSFYRPLGYQGDSKYLIVIFNIILCAMSLFIAPIIGFIYRKILRIKSANQQTLPKLVYRRVVKNK
ncbi:MULTISPECIES: MAGa3780 family membrane protein [unclassified Mycoplasma]|uniref:MAGa3780 family membrane protein n=1 Tax=unclassified Mycoplasma TaxID=2683645 RepID=UPI00211B7CB4|nr:MULTISPECIES: hypothetical protein [unclassified Mycoplasma]UUM19538.1 hypothetical protein NPA11_02035 [Mycoplasma sp. 1578d]UUM24458.1 hypothetical protein NPA12_02015 [Mycoplasma sp. 3686d]